MRRCSGRMTKPPAYPFRYLAMSNSRGTKQTAVANPTWRQQPVRPEFPVAPSPRQEPYLAIPHPTVKNLLDNLPRRHPGPPGSASRLPRPSQRPRRSVKRDLGKDETESKRILQKSFAPLSKNFHLLDCTGFPGKALSRSCSGDHLKASRIAIIPRIASGFPGQIL